LASITTAIIVRRLWRQNGHDGLTKPQKKTKEKPFVSYADNEHRNKTAEPSTYGHHRWYPSDINELESAEHNKSKQ
jgi:hypothetical protein